MVMDEDLDDGPPFDFERWFASKDPSEQERLNLIVMNYFNLNNDIYDPVESNYHLESIAAEYDLMQHGEDTKFIQHMTEGPVELGRVGAYDKPMEEMTVGDLDTMYGVPINYDPDDRADLEMKYTSSDVFTDVWSVLKNDQRIAPQWMKVEDPPYVGDDEITGVGMNEIPPQGDECCEDLRTELIRLDHKYQGTTAELLFEHMQFMQDEGCAELEDALDDLTQYAEHLLSTYLDPDASAVMHRMNPKPFDAVRECLDELQQAKLEYDSCKGTQFGDVNHLDFTASEDPFEIAWDMVIKMPIRPGSLHQKRREYSYFNPKRKAKQFMDQIPPLMAVPIDEGDESDDDQLSYEAIYDHDDGFSHTPATIVGPEGIIAERVDTPDSSEIIAGREDKRVWGDPLSQRREWWLQGPHGDLYARRGDGKGNVAMEEGNQYRIEEGNLQGKDREKLMEYLEMLSTMMNQHGDELILDNDVRMMPNPDLERKS